MSPAVQVATHNGIPSPPSPTLDNPDMVLPDGGDTARDLAAPAAVRPPSPSYLREQMDRGSPKDNKTALKKSLGPMSQRQGLQRSITAEDSTNLPGSFVEPDNDSDSGFPDAKKWAQAGLQRSFSIISASTISLDLDAIPEYKYDDGESDIFTLDGPGSGTATPTRSVAGDVSALNGRPVSGRRTSEKFSAELSRRAELILANAKKRLNLMDQNLKGARALTAENLQRATSLHVHETSYASRYLSSPDNDSSEQTITHRLGHNRNRSDIPQMHSPVQARHAMMEEPLAEESEDSGVRSSGQLRASKSQELPRRSKPFNSTRNVSMGDSSITNDPAAATDDLKKQVQSLNKRISMLRERTKEDSVKRQSFLNERGASPFTNADGVSTADVLAKPVSRWSADSEIRRQSMMNPADVLSKDQARERRQSKRRSKKLDWGPAGGSRMSRSLKISRFSLETEASQSTDEEGETSSIDNVPSAGDKASTDAPGQAHEDREDAFDYHNFFLHSSLGRTASSSDSASASSSRRSSQASDETARGPDDTTTTTIPTINALPDLDSAPQDTPEKLRAIERTLHHRRLASFDSSVSNTSFATAAETAESRSISPVRPAPSAAPAPQPQQQQQQQQLEVPKPPAPQRPLSMQVAARVAEIEGPRAAVAVAAASDPDRPPLGLKDKALLFMLMEAVQGACAKLQDPNTGVGEAGVMRRRLEQARKVLEGTAPVV